MRPAYSQLFFSQTAENRGSQLSNGGFRLIMWKTCENVKKKWPYLSQKPADGKVLKSSFHPYNVLSTQCTNWEHYGICYCHLRTNLSDIQSYKLSMKTFDRVDFLANFCVQLWPLDLSIFLLCCLFSTVCTHWLTQIMWCIILIGNY